MKYILLAYRDEQQLATMSIHDLSIFTQACQASDALLRSNGRLLAVTILQRSSVITVRFQHDKVLVNAGSYASIKEQLIGIFTIQARDLNEAIQVAAKMPQARNGPIEVHPLIESQ